MKHLKLYEEYTYELNESLSSWFKKKYDDALKYMSSNKELEEIYKMTKEKIEEMHPEDRDILIEKIKKLRKHDDIAKGISDILTSIGFGGLTAFVHWPVISSLCFITAVLSLILMMAPTGKDTKRQVEIKQLIKDIDDEQRKIRSGRLARTF
jgi:hypothetical protein